MNVSRRILAGVALAFAVWLVAGARALAADTAAPAVAATQPAADAVIEQWGIFEVSISNGPEAGNPFTDIQLSATFSHGDQSRRVAGFYDGGGVYRVRFMPGELGAWTYRTESKAPELNGKSGSFTCGKPSPANHGPVGVRNTFHFAYADGSPYRELGTTCYDWVHQDEPLEEQTLTTLRDGPFNKLRMCVFPTEYAPNENVPLFFPYEGTPPATWDLTRFNPAFFRHLEKRVRDLGDMGIEADIILFHPYDRGRLGFDQMDAASDDRYLRYVVSRLAAYRNVWWSMANEFDLMTHKTDADWDRFFQIVQASDPYGHLRGIHHDRRIYDNSKPWVTHASLQNGEAVADFGRAVLYRDVWYKPVVLDEVQYEGNIDRRWGQLTGEEMVHRFWQGTIAGTYVGHGEAFVNKGPAWTSKGTVLHGTSPPRLAFLRKVLETAPPGGIDPIDKWQDLRTAGKAGEYYLVYFGKEEPKEWVFDLPKAKLTGGMAFRVEVLDTWDMTVAPVEGLFKIAAEGQYRYQAEGHPSVKLPGKPYIALRITRAE